MATTDEDGPGRCRVMALDPEDGSVLWNQYAGDSVKNRLSFGGGLIYGVTVTGNVFTLAAESGRARVAASDGRSVPALGLFCTCVPRTDAFLRGDGGALSLPGRGERRRGLGAY